MVEWIKIDINHKDVKTGQKVIGAFQHFYTKNYRYHEVKKADEDDCTFRTVDDNSEVSYDWTLTHYIIPETPQ